jgi:ubiquinone/menaquinone biosynthesis C-methylase UbiE
LHPVRIAPYPDVHNDTITYHTRMTTSDHPFDYDHAAATYDAHRQGRGPYFPTLLRLAAACPPGPVLEVGAGTGNNTCAFIEDSRREMFALEPSRGMLAQGRAKAATARWTRGRVEAMPFRAGAFSMIYGTYMLHHVQDLDRAFAECARCIDHGAAAFVTVSHEFIAAHPMNAYFPSFARVDQARFQPIARVLEALAGAGFTRTAAEHTYAEARAIDAAYAEKIADKFISTYALLPEAELATGLARLRGDIQQHGGALPQPMIREAVVVYGWKP